MLEHRCSESQVHVFWGNVLDVLFDGECCKQQNRESGWVTKRPESWEWWGCDTLSQSGKELSDFAPSRSTWPRTGDICDPFLSFSLLPTACFQWPHRGQLSFVMTLFHKPKPPWYPGRGTQRKKGATVGRMAQICAQNCFWKNNAGIMLSLSSSTFKIHLSISLPSIQPLIHLSVHPSIYPLIYPSHHLSINISTYLFIYTSTATMSNTSLVLPLCQAMHFIWINPVPAIFTSLWCIIFIFVLQMRKLDTKRLGNLPKVSHLYLSTFLHVYILSLSLKWDSCHWSQSLLFLFLSYLSTCHLPS